MKKIIFPLFCFLFLFITREAQGAFTAPKGGIVIESVETRRTLDFMPQLESWSTLARYALTIEYTVLLDNQEIVNLWLYKTFDPSAKKTAQNYFKRFTIIPDDAIWIKLSGHGIFENRVGVTVKVKQVNASMSGYSDNLEYLLSD